MEDPKRLEEGSHHAPIVPGDPKVTELKVDENKMITKENEEPNDGEKPILVKEKSKRVATLDAFRGLTIVVS